MAALIRGLRRASIPLRYSEGFHPKPRLGFSPATGVGVASLAEFVDVDLVWPLDAEEVRRRVAAVLPRGLEVVSARRASLKEPSISVSIAEVVYAIRFEDARVLENARGRFSAFQASPSCEIERRAKDAERGEMYDLKRWINGAREEEGAFVVRVRAERDRTPRVAEIVGGLFGLFGLEAGDAQVTKLEVVLRGAACAPAAEGKSFHRPGES
jgi:radical SAM-linked protein